MIETLCNGAKAMAAVYAELEKPGVLSGRARSVTFRERMARFSAWIIDFHGLDAFAHTFPIIRDGVGSILHIPGPAIQRLIKLAERIGLIVRKTDLVRRCHDETISPTKGSNGAWWTPLGWDIGPKFLALLPPREVYDSGNPAVDEDRSKLADPSLENQFDPKKLTTVSEDSSTVESISDEVYSEAPATDRIDSGQASRKAVDRRISSKVSEDRPSSNARREGSQGDPELDPFDAELQARMQAKYGRMTLSAEAQKLLDGGT